ncbi:MAG: hypothetical protein PHW34_15190 [Hespellia sp.]|nr:hypothetical protein [Hespellia sp.]
MPSLDALNFIIAVIALCVALYSICYTRKQNHPRITVSSGESYVINNSPTMSRFELNNMSPVPVTILSITFADINGNSIYPVEYEPQCSPMEYIPEYMYSDHFCFPCILHPYQETSFGYYFATSFETIVITVVCNECIHHFKKKQSFVTHFLNVQE